MIKWLKRLGVAGFLFFLIKGLIWIGIFFYIKSCSEQKKTDNESRSKRERAAISQGL
jgi:hypothetical protein